MLDYLLNEALQDDRTSKTKVSLTLALRITFLTGACSGQALVRDGYRCVLTGRFDLVSMQQMPDILKPLARASGQPPVVTRATYIIPESTNVGISGDKEGDDKASLLSSASVAFFFTMHG
jgi:hypothetical protein